MEEPDTDPLDEEVLSAIRGRLLRDDRFERVMFEPTTDRIRNLGAEYDQSLLPNRIQSARLDIRWYIGGDFSVHYCETDQKGTQWECRWNRHPKPVGRTHFHPPPNAGQATAADFPSDYRDVISIVTAYIAERVETLWK